MYIPSMSLSLQFLYSLPLLYNQHFFNPSVSKGGTCFLKDVHCWMLFLCVLICSLKVISSTLQQSEAILELLGLTELYLMWLGKEVFFKGPNGDLLLSWLFLSPGECCLLSASVEQGWKKSPRCPPIHPLHRKHRLLCKRQCSPPSQDPSSLLGWSNFSSDPHSSQFPCHSDSTTSWGDLS